MTPKKKKGITSCFECIAAKSCFGDPNPKISRTEAREYASSCQLFRKGKSTDTVEVVGWEKGISRKKAEKLVEQGKAQWVQEKTVKMIE